MKKILLSIVLALCFSSLAFSQARYRVFYSPNVNAHLGAENILSLNKGIDYLLDYNHQINKAENRRNLLGKTTNFPNRLGKLIFVDYLKSNVLSTFLHEYIGHYQYAKRFGSNKLSFELNFDGSGVTTFNSKTFNSKVSVSDRVMIALAGIESGNVLMSTLSNKIFSESKINYHDAFLYFNTILDTNSYIGSIEKNTPSHDMTGYIKDINEIYPHTSEGTIHNKLKLYANLSLLLNPLLFNSAYTSFYSFLGKGKLSSDVFWLYNGNNFKYNGLFRVNLSRFGPELVYDNFIKYNDKLFNLSLKDTDSYVSKTYAINLKAFNLELSKNKLWMDFETQIWHQPELDYFYNDKSFHKSEGVGGLASVAFHYKLSKLQRKNFELNLFTKFGYKSAGYSEGYTLNGQALFDFGLSYSV